MADQRPPRIIAVPGRLRGSAWHYYHFLLGYFAPLMLTLRDIEIRSPVSVANCGPLNRHWVAVEERQFVPRRWKRAAQTGEAVRRAAVVLRPPPCDDRRVFHRVPWSDLRDATSAAIGVRPSLDAAQGSVEAEDRIAVIARDSATGTDGGRHTGRDTTGAERRSIPNVGEVAAALDALGDVSLVAFEGQPLVDQATAMRDADVVVAQHGGALANLLWCRPGTIVVEVNPTPNALFAVLSERLGLRHHVVPQLSDHAVVEPALVAQSVALAQKAARFDESPTAYE